MPIQIKCSCGKLLGVPEKLAGKQVKCPDCGAPVRVPAGQPPEPRVQVVCTCGAFFQAPARLKGKSVKCPKCGGLTEVAPQDDEEESSSTYGVATNRCVHCGVDLQAGTVLCMRCGTNQQTGQQMQQAAEQPRQASARAAVPVKAVVGILAGVVVLAVGYWLFAGRGGSKPAASQPAAPPSAGQTPAAKPSGVESKPAAAQAPAAAAATPSAALPPAAPAASVPASPSVASVQPAPAAAPPPVRDPPGQVVEPKKVFGDDSEWVLERYVYAPHRAKDRVALEMAQKSINMFEMAEGRKPASLKEVVDKGYGPLNPVEDGLELGMDANTGKAVLYRVERKQKKK
jgi:hypothetical protein